MKKVICPACGMVNLEKFVTFPHCAACGASLSEAPHEQTPVWQRPVDAILWAMVLGLCCVALAVAGILTARETRRIEERTLVVYVQIPRHLRIGQKSQLRVGLDSVEANNGVSPAFPGLQMRLPQAFFRDFTLVSISPTPRSKVVRGNATYFEFGNLPRDQLLVLSFLPRRSGLSRLAFSLGALGFSNFDWRGNLEVVAAAPARSVPRAKSRPALRRARAQSLA